MMNVFRAAALALAALGVAAVLLAAPAGCASRPMVPPQEPASPTDGLSLQMWYAIPSGGQYQMFRVKETGEFQYGGGMVAMNRNTDWTGQLTLEEAKQVRALVDKAGWMTAKDPARKEGDSPIAEIELSGGGSSRRFQINGPDPAVAELATMLQKVADQRFNRFLQRLPEGGAQPR